MERVLRDCSGDNSALREGPIRDSVQTAAERFQLAYEALAERLLAYVESAPSDSGRTVPDAEETPLALLKRATRAAHAGGRDSAGAEQAHLILRMAEWYRENRRELREEEIARLPSTIRR